MFVLAPLSLKSQLFLLEHGGHLTGPSLNPYWSFNRASMMITIPRCPLHHPWTLGAPHIVQLHDRHGWPGRIQLTEVDFPPIPPQGRVTSWMTGSSFLLTSVGGRTEWARWSPIRSRAPANVGSLDYSRHKTSRILCWSVKRSHRLLAFYLKR